jgi:hypothetical protein
MADAENTNREQIEKVRQEIMRFRELLNIMRGRMDQGERAYAQLFANCPPEDKQRLKEKDLQWLVASQIVGDVSELRTAVMDMRFGAYELERAFEELYDIIVTVNEEESEGRD